MITTNKDWELFKRKIFGRHSSLWLYSKPETIAELEKYLLQHNKEIVEKIKDREVDVRPEITVWNTHKTRGEAEAYNQAIKDILSLLEEKGGDV
jgi:hypothetical protein